MGLIRKSLFLGTGGLGPNWNSNKERTRKAAEKSARIQGVEWHPFRGLSRALVARSI